jgi:general stress protein 26
VSRQRERFAAPRLAIFAGILLALALLAVPGPARAAEAGARSAGVEEVLAVARRVIEAARYATLVTIGEDGRAESRIVDPFPPEADLTIWIGTKRGTRKLAQIAADPRVTLTWIDEAGAAYVTILGDAMVVDDPAEKAKHWKEEWSAFYADANRGPDYVLIRVTPKRLEALAPDLPNDPVSWRPRQVEPR